MNFFKRAAAAAPAVVLAAAAIGAPAMAANVNVIVNGRAMNFDQPPVMRAGRVFVPMRAIFERLGATVVYANGVINATGNGRRVHLAIGSTQASVNGNGLAMDVAPFTIAGRTEVPLRFVAQALGAGVQWDANTSTVYINAGGGGNAPPPSTPSANASFHFTSTTPGNGATVNTTHPLVRASFSEAVNRDSLKVMVDAHDVTSDVYANPSGFEVTPSFELAPGTHKVTASGTTVAGASFSTSFSFTTSAGATPNSVSAINPVAGAKVNGNFTLRGHTLPNSKVHIVAAGSSSALGGLLQIGTGTFQTDVTADANGNFSAPIAVNAIPGGNVTVIITSTSPSGASIERRVVYST